MCYVRSKLISEGGIKRDWNSGIPGKSNYGNLGKQTGIAATLYYPWEYWNKLHLVTGFSLWCLPARIREEMLKSGNLIQLSFQWCLRASISRERQKICLTPLPNCYHLELPYLISISAILLISSILKLTWPAWVQTESLAMISWVYASQEICKMIRVMSDVYLIICQSSYIETTIWVTIETMIRVTIETMIRVTIETMIRVTIKTMIRVKIETIIRVMIETMIRVTIETMNRVTSQNYTETFFLVKAITETCTTPYIMTGFSHRNWSQNLFVLWMIMNILIYCLNVCMLL